MNQHINQVTDKPDLLEERTYISSKLLSLVHSRNQHINQVRDKNDLLKEPTY